MPVKEGPRICLATRGDIAVPGQVTGGLRIVLPQCFYHSCQLFILSVIEWLIVTSLQLDADGEIVAVFSPLILRPPGVPGTLIEWHKLHHFAISPNEQMRRHLQLADLGKIGVRLRGKLPEEKLLDVGAAKLAGRQTDVVQHRQ